MNENSIEKLIFSNHKDFGGAFEAAFSHHIESCISLEIATGYFGVSVLDRYSSALINVARRGSCKILVGMVFNEGVSAVQKSALEKLHADLTGVNSRSGVYITLRNYHGKVYRFNYGDADSIYVGSSNFSDSGLKFNYEFNALVKESHTKAQILKFLQFVFGERCDFVKPLSLVELSAKGLRAKAEKAEINDLKSLKVKYNELPKGQEAAVIKIKLRPDSQPRSSLNLCFEKGRLSNGKYTPRPWYEVEVTCTKKEISQFGYPIGDFNAYIKHGSDYYRIPMVTASDGYKALTSKNNRHILGFLIKDRLERSGALRRGEVITSETLAEYGNDELILKKFPNNEYVLEF